MSWSEVYQGLILNHWGLLAAMLVALVCAYLGVFVLLKRIVFVGLALAQISSAGIALAFLVGPSLAALADRYIHGTGIEHHAGHCLFWIAVRPMFFSLAVTVLGVLLLARFSLARTFPRDSAVGAVYAVAYGLTLLFILRSPKGMEDVRELLDGSVLTTSLADLWYLVGLVVGVAVLHGSLFKQHLFVAFDPESAAAQGYRVGVWEVLFYLVLGVSTSIAIQKAGVLMVFAYMVLPPLAGLLAGRRMPSVLAIATASALFSCVAGFILALKWDLPLSPPTIGVALCAVLGAAIISRRL